MLPELDYLYPFQNVSTYSYDVDHLSHADNHLSTAAVFFKLVIKIFLKLQNKL